MKYFSTLDLWAGYHHIPLDESSTPKTAFTSPFWKYEYIEAPFWLTQAPAYFLGTHDRCLEGFSLHYCLLGWYNHLQQNSRGTSIPHQTGFWKLQNTHLSVKLSKYHFFAKEIHYFWHILSTTGNRLLPSKTQAVNNMHPPKTAKQVCTFLGFVSYYRMFIKDFAKMTKSLTFMTHNKAKFEWTPVHHTAFMILNEAIMQAPILCYPNSARRYIVYMDVSDDVCGAQLSQEHDRTKFPIAFLSHTFTETQRKWSTPEQETYGVCYAITKGNYYLKELTS